MPRLNVSLYFLLPCIAAVSICAQDPSDTQKKLKAEFAVTQPTADNTDIVTAGAVLTLKTGKIVMFAVSSGTTCVNNYKDGKIDHKLCDAVGGGTKVPKFFRDRLPGGVGSAADAAPSARTFVPGEKMWVTKIDVKANDVQFELLTDPFSDVRYRALLHFPLPQGISLSPDQVTQLVEQVFSAQAPEASGEGQQQGTQQQQQGNPPQQQGDAQQQQGNPPKQTLPQTPAPPQEQPQEAKPAVVVPPPPPPPSDQPPAQPKTISKGQTPDQVIAILGQPKKIVKLDPKQIYYYDDLKIVFVNGKVSDVE